MVLPLLKPIVANNGVEVREIIVPKGTDIMVANLGANTNPEFWGDDAYEWKPERWQSPLPDSITQAHFPGVYSNMFVSILFLPLPDLTFVSG
jgi:cytochrome P450